MPIVEKQWTTTIEQTVSIEVSGGVRLKGELILPEETFGLAIFAAGSNVGRSSSSSRRIARELEQQGLSVLLFDLLTPDEQAQEARAGHRHLDIPLLAGRLLEAAAWAVQQPELRAFPLGFYGAGNMAPVALVAAAEQPGAVAAVVCRGGRVDLAGNALARVQAPTRLIVGAADGSTVRANESALLRLGSARKELVMIPGVSSRFDDPVEVDCVAELASEWFGQHLILLN